ncbi:hypothetical protein [Gordonia paraffinivorans]|uniref:hypothetical protein n=1 Tax=Gordonia paraffinivorans TaxID=175628 RepID=UPI00243067EF|nr:hypothetical protein [Gordonia paraffinivorans]
MTPDACRHRLAEVAEPPGCEIPKEGRIDLDLQALTRQAGRRSPATVMFADTRVVVAGTGSTAVSNLGRYLTNPDWGPYTANTRGSHFFTDPLFLTLEHRNTEGVEDRPSPVLTFTADYDDSGQLTEISGLAEYESDGRELAPRLRTFPLDADDTDRIVLHRHPDSTDSQETTMAHTISGHQRVLSALMTSSMRLACTQMFSWRVWQVPGSLITSVHCAMTHPKALKTHRAQSIPSGSSPETPPTQGTYPAVADTGSAVGSAAIGSMTGS